MQQVWDSKEISFKKMEVTTNPEIAKTILAVEIGKMDLIIGSKMNEYQMEYLIDIILTDYYSYTISDITVLTKRLASSKNWGQPTMQNIVHELELYSIDKQEFAVEQRIKENSLHKQELLDNEKILKAYERMKAEAKEYKPTAKEKALEAAKLNEEKLKEMKRLGLIE